MSYTAGRREGVQRVMEISTLEEDLNSLRVATFNPRHANSTARSNAVMVIGANSFTPGTPVYHNGTTWVAASASDLDPNHLPSGVVDWCRSNAYRVVLNGMAIGLTLAPGTLYYLAVGGGLTVTPPAAPNLVVQVLRSISGTSALVTLGQRPQALSDLRDIAAAPYEETVYGLNFLTYHPGTVGDPSTYTYSFTTPGIGTNFGAGTLPAYIVDGNGAAASASSWRATGALWVESSTISEPLKDIATSPQKTAIGFGPTGYYAVPPAGAGGPLLWLDPNSSGNFVSTRPARGKDTAPVGYRVGSKMLMFPLLASVFWNRLRDLQDVEDLAGSDPTDGLCLVWDLASKTYKHQTFSTAAMADDSVTNAKLRNSAAFSVIGNPTNALADPQDITAGADNLVLARKAGALGFFSVSNAMLDTRPAYTVVANGTSGVAVPTDIAAATDDLLFGRSAGALGFFNVNTAMVADDAITNAKLRNSGGTSVIGRAAGGAGDPADITAASDDLVLGRQGGALGFFTVNTASIANSAVTTAKMAASGVTPATYGGSGGTVFSATIDASGRITAATDRTLTAADVGAATAGHSHTLSGDVSGPISATVIGTGKVLTAMIGANQVTPAKFAQVAAVSVLCNPTAALADVDKITASADGQVVRLAGTTLSFGAVDFSKPAAITGALPVANGGHAGTTAAEAAFNLGLASIAGWTATATYSATGAFTHTWGAGKKMAIVEIIGAGGGGGGGSAGTVGGSSSGGGGGGGERVLLFIKITGASVTGSVGTGGAAGGATAANGTAGGNTTFNSISAQGGDGGTGDSDGGLGGGSSTTVTPGTDGTEIRIPGVNGQPSRVYSIGYSAGVISNYLTRRGLGGSALGGGYGGGGAGGPAGSAGVAGGSGVVRVWEI